MAKPIFTDISSDSACGNIAQPSIIITNELIELATKEAAKNIPQGSVEEKKDDYFRWSDAEESSFSDRNLKSLATIEFL